MNCELCGKVSDRLLTATIEGVVMRVCPACARFGTVAAPPPAERLDTRRKPTVQRQRKPESVETVVPGYAELLADARARRGLTQEEVAHAVNEKVSVIHQLESGHIEPSIALARKLERFYHLALVETQREDDFRTAATEGHAQGLTIGDVIRVRKRP